SRDGSLHSMNIADFVHIEVQPLLQPQSRLPLSLVAATRLNSKKILLLLIVSMRTDEVFGHGQSYPKTDSLRLSSATKDELRLDLSELNPQALELYRLLQRLHQRDSSCYPV